MTGKPQNTIHPRKFKEKIELLKQKEAELNANFLAAMRDMQEIRMATNVWELSSQKNTSPPGLHLASDFVSPKDNLSTYQYGPESRDSTRLRYGNREQRDGGVTDARTASETKPPFTQQSGIARSCSTLATTAPVIDVTPTTTFSSNSTPNYQDSLKPHPFSSDLQSGNSPPSLPPTPTSTAQGGFTPRRNCFTNSSSALKQRTRTSPRSAYGSCRQAPYPVHSGSTRGVPGQHQPQPYLRPQPYPPCYPRVLEGSRTPQQHALRLEMPPALTDSRTGPLRMNLVDYRRTASDSAIPNSFDASHCRPVEQLPPVTELTKMPQQPQQANSGNVSSIESPYYGSSYPSVLPPDNCARNGKVFSAIYDPAIPPSFPTTYHQDNSSHGRQCFQSHTSPPANNGAGLPSPLDCPPLRVRYPSAAVTSHPALNCIGSSASGNDTGRKRQPTDSSAASTGNLPRSLETAFSQTLMPDHHPHHQNSPSTQPLLSLDQQPVPVPSRFFPDDVGPGGSAAVLNSSQMQHQQPKPHPLSQPQHVHSLHRNSPYGPPYSVAGAPTLMDSQVPKAAAQSMYLTGSLSMQNLPAAQELAMRTNKLVNNDPVAVSTPQFKVDLGLNNSHNFPSGLQPISQFAASLSTPLPSSDPSTTGLPPITAPTSEPGFCSDPSSASLNTFTVSTEHERRDSFTMAAELFSRIEKRNAVLTAVGWAGSDDEQTTATDGPDLPSSVSDGGGNQRDCKAGMAVATDEKVLAVTSDVDPFFLPLSANDYQLLNDPNMADYVTDDLTEAQLVQEHYMGTSGSNLCSS